MDRPGVAPTGWLRALLARGNVLIGGATFTGQSKFADGTAAAPSIAFTNDLDTGIYRPGANRVGIAANGTLIGDFNSAGIVLGTASIGTTIKGADANADAGTTASGSWNGGRGVHAVSGVLSDPSASSVGFDSNAGAMRLYAHGVISIFTNGPGDREQVRVLNTAAPVNVLTLTAGASGANAVASTTGENLQLMTGAALATTATAGMILIPTTTGTPTGAPTGAGAGAIPMLYDTGAHKIWFYAAGAWRGVLVA